MRRGPKRRRAQQSKQDENDRPLIKNHTNNNNRKKKKMGSRKTCAHGQSKSNFAGDVDSNCDDGRVGKTPRIVLVSLKSLGRRWHRHCPNDDDTHNNPSGAGRPTPPTRWRTCVFKEEINNVTVFLTLLDAMSLTERCVCIVSNWSKHQSSSSSVSTASRLYVSSIAE